MTPTPDLHVLGIDVDLADLPEVFADSLVEGAITGNVIGTVCTCR